ncbi:MAG: single-stranded-DNA-specific exonuclease RecJ [Planctomycetota bacterium]|nr:single-stranded-DNA-specific exonuclease RecJ [Planctomycetota bacterium]
MPKDWVIETPWTDRERLAGELGVAPIVAQVLFNRGVSDVEAARKFLNPRATDILPPETLPNCEAAAERIFEAVRRGERIVIFGDYDVDGITAVSILWHCLRIAEAGVDYYIPHRLEEGYGISTEAIEAIAKDGARMIISVDCGVTAIEPAKRAKELGVELIITDHHQPQNDESGTVQLPDALIVHPGIEPDGGDPYANPNLSGAGVALKLVWAIAQKFSNARKVSPEFREFLVDAMGLAALGTVADVVPLTGENRIIASHGLLGLPKSRLAGIQALIHTAGLAGKKLDGFDIGFKLAPRLNAIGRMGHARLAVEMLTRADADGAVKIAGNLEQQNRARQTLQRRIVAEARAMVREQGQDSDAVRAIVLASEGWHAGVIGIVASRIMEEFGRPTVMIALENGAGQGSARSIRNFPLDQALGDCRSHLISYGGHAMAAGLRIEAEQVDSFRQAFQSRAGQLLTAKDLNPGLRIDDCVSLSQLDEKLVRDLGRLEPFGCGNGPPHLATEYVSVLGEPRTVGSTGDHLQVTLGDGRVSCKGIAFGMAKYRPELQNHRRCRVAFRPMINEWNGRRTVEMQVLDFHFPDD